MASTELICWRSATVVFRPLTGAALWVLAFAVRDNGSLTEPLPSDRSPGLQHSAVDDCPDRRGLPSSATPAPSRSSGFVAHYGLICAPVCRTPFRNVSRHRFVPNQYASSR